MIDLCGLEQQPPRKNDRPEAAALVGVLKAKRTMTRQRFERVWDALPIEVEQLAQAVAKHGHAHEKSFAAETAAITGMTCKTCIHRPDLTLWGWRPTTA